MANPGDLDVKVALDRIDALVKTLGEWRVRLEAVEARLATLDAINVLDAEIALIRDGMSQTALGGGE